MATERVRRSDYSDTPIPEGTGARVRVQLFDSGRLDRKADLTDEEVEKLLAFTVEVTPRPTRRGGRASRFSQ